MNWGDYAVGMVSGMGIGASVIGFLTGRTINTYRKVVADYEQMLCQLIVQLTGINPQKLRQLLIENLPHDDLIERLEEAVNESRTVGHPDRASEVHPG